MTAELMLLIVLGYLIGSVPSAYLAGKWFCGIDIREYGSSNVGVSNLIRTASWRAGLLPVIFDFGKGLLPAWAAHRMGLGIASEAAVGTAAIIGHNWPVFLRFNGGRGMLTTIGVLFILPLINGLMPWETIAFFACAAASFFIIHNIPVGTGAGVAVSPLISWITGRPAAQTLGFLTIFLILVTRRLTVPRAAEAVNVSAKQLIVNRLFLDRDIREREAWLNRKAVKKVANRQPELTAKTGYKVHREKQR